MHNDVDDRRGRQLRAYDRNAHYEELDDQGYEYEDDGLYDDDGRSHPPPGVPQRNGVDGGGGRRLGGHGR